MKFDWRDAFQVILGFAQAIFAAVEAGKSRDEAIREAVSVVSRREQIETDVAEAMDGRASPR